MPSRKNEIFLALILVTGVLAGVALAQRDSDLGDADTSPAPMTFAWTVPTTGSPVVRYEVQIRKILADSTVITNHEVSTNEITFAVEGFLIRYQVRVRGVDAANRAGPWSRWSQVENRDHAPPDL